MSPHPGDMLLHYRLAESIGEGGMGVVWKAIDTKLEREVAIKILPADVSHDAVRLARFEREAKSLAALNHPNVAQVHGLEHSAGTHFLVMELVPGEDLAERIARGRLPQAEALQIGLQIATALEEAHARGIVHRDLKPANVRVTPDGRVKVLDFGLVKVIGPSTEDGDLSLSPTVTSGGTKAGVILGTAAYMSPEQARGKPVDKRSDVWAFGCVMLELLTGEPPFRGDTVTDTLAAVLERQPDLDALPAETSPGITRLIRRCLQKDPGRRLRDIGDAALEIDEVFHVPETEAVASGAADRPYWGWLALAIAAVALAMWWVGSRDDGNPATDSSRPLLLSAVVPDGMAIDHGELPTVAISPDSRWLAFVALKGETNKLYLRSMDSTDVVEIPDSAWAASPFFSPDSQWLAFLQGNRVMKVAVTGGAPASVGWVPPIARGFDWGQPDEIVYTRSKRSGLYALAVEDGTTRTISRPDPEAGEVVHNWAHVLQGRDEILVTVVDGDTTSYDEARIVAFDPENGSRRVLIEGGYRGRLMHGDVLVFVRNGQLLAVRVDSERWVTLGSPVPVVGGFMADPSSGSASLSISDDGTMVLAPGGSYDWQSGKLVWIDRSGEVTPVMEESRPFRYPRISPDGTRVAFTIEDINDDVWIHELERGVLTRATFEDRNMGPIWRPGFDEICFSAVGLDDRSPQLWSVKVDSQEPRRRLLGESKGTRFCGSWTPDGMTLAFMDWNATEQFNILVAADGASAAPQPFAATRFSEHSPRFSPNGKWLAYSSDESGTVEVYIQPFPGPGGKWKISEDGGAGPVWRRDGKELFYLNGTKMMAVSVSLAPQPSIGRPRTLFDGTYARRRLPWVTNYDVSPDGQRFLVIVQDPLPQVREIRVLQDWLSDVEAKLDGSEG